MHSARSIVITFCSLFTLLSPIPVRTQDFHSDNRQGSLLELYTSQGCSSCPPAEAWLSQLKKHPALWQLLFPIALHVDYWDHLGWKDPYSLADNSARQRRYNRLGATNAVYTPGFILNGREWRVWFLQRGHAEPPLSNKQTGRLSANVSQQQVTAEFTPALAAQVKVNPLHRLSINIAILGFDIQTAIPAGENRGKALSQDFVLLSRLNVAISEDGRWHARIPNTTIAAGSRRAIVIWLEDPQTAAPIQITGGWLVDEQSD